MRCGFVSKISEEDRAKIEKLWEDAGTIEKPHEHVWCNWLPGKMPGLEFRKCIDCGVREDRQAAPKR